jgi:hypothetical protein
MDAIFIENLTSRHWGVPVGPLGAQFVRVSETLTRQVSDADSTNSPWLIQV